MEPKDLKNPDGLKSMQDEEANAGKNAASNDEKKKKESAEEKEKDIQEVSNAESGVTEDQTGNEPDAASESGSEKEKDEDDQAETSPEEAKEESSQSIGIEEPEESSIEDNTEKLEETKQEDNIADENNETDESEKPAEPVKEVQDEMKEPGETEDGDAGKEKTEAAGEEEVKDDTPAKEPEADSEDKKETEQEIKAEEKSQEEPAAKTKPEEETIASSATKKDKPAAEKVKISEPIITKKGKTDYSALSFIELVNALSDVLDSNGDHDIKEEVEAIKAEFYKKVKDEAEEQKTQFLEEGGEEEDFQAQENPYEQDIKDHLKRYRQLRHEFNKKLEHEKEINLQLKYEIIEEIKGLIHKEESINKTFQDFRDLQQRWREIGLVPQLKMKDLWDTYHFHVENFYDYIKINQELRDLDLKKNLEVKIRLCEQAEELLLESNTIKAFNQLQKLHDRWREAGPVPRENKDDIWERFKAATAKINKKHQDYFEERKQEQKKNLEAKKALCEQVEEINEMEIDNHKEWSEKSKDVVNLQRIWRTIGFAPHKENNRIYSRFREACDKFFDAKREFYSKNKELQQNNLQMKIDLCMQAEALKESTDWRKSTQDLINIQKQWKEIGPVPRKQSDAIWKRFRAACDYFFDKKSEHFSSIDTEQDVNLKQKEELIKEVENFKSTGNVDENLKKLKDFQRRWTEIGHVPIRKKDETQKRFRDAINKLFDDLNMDESNRNLLKFRTKMVSFSESSRGQNKMRLERDKYMTKLKQLENDLVLLDNNIGFFAKSKNAESLIEDVQRKIEQTKEKIEFLKNKIRVIDEMDSSEE